MWRGNPLELPARESITLLLLAFPDANASQHAQAVRELRTQGIRPALTIKTMLGSEWCVEVENYKRGLRSRGYTIKDDEELTARLQHEFINHYANHPETIERAATILGFDHAEAIIAGEQARQWIKWERDLYFPDANY